MRLVTFQSVYEGVVSRHGLDPVGDVISQDAKNAIARKITTRAKKALDTWDWTEFSRTEERAFRSVWNAFRNFHIVGEEGRPDELYYLGDAFTDAGYYRVKADAPGDPPAGVKPTDTTYFEPLTIPEPYIDRSQTCQRTIGSVLGIYKTDPSVNGSSSQNNGSFPGVSYQPSEHGIKVCCGDVGTTVFLWYLIPPPKYTMKPYIAGKAYKQGDRVYFAPPDGDGNCYRALVDNIGNIPTNPDFWTLEPVPEALADYLEAGAYADTIRDRINGEPLPATAANEIAMANEEAEGYLRNEIDNLLSQGQKHFYGGANWWKWTGLWSSQPWGGDRVTYLTDVCVSDGLPVVPVSIGSPWEYHPEIVSLTGPTQSLSSLNTTGRQSGAMVELVIGPSGDKRRQTWQLVPLAANPADGGQIAPLDYNAVTNNVHWELVG